ncbi:LysR family transcriptional regulator [Ferrimonas pelagia]|uniref:LysR family transcriptional regulator n=1 Tax=Ferrimonas pelagia TaxID=1177826 RepID=A0ABP9EWN0_9GAMM
MQIADLQLVLKIAQLRSITAAAVELDMRTATASAALKRVETQLGAQLFTRTTRQLRLSAAGEKFLPKCEEALALLTQAQLNLQEDASSVEGVLRLGLSSDLGRNRVLPWLDEFTRTYPDLRLRLNITDSNVDFYRDPVDVALRYGAPKDAGLYGFKICDVPRVVCASPDYLAEQGTPTTPAQLVDHIGLLYQLYDVLHDVWHFRHASGDCKVRITQHWAANDGDLVRRWCVAGRGVAVKSCLDMAEDLLNGRVKPLLRGYDPTPTELWLIFPSRQSISPAARLLRQLLTEKTQVVLTQLREQGLLAPPQFC